MSCSQHAWMEEEDNFVSPSGDPILVYVRSCFHCGFISESKMTEKIKR